jgi:hypothetical protein
MPDVCLPSHGSSSPPGSSGCGVRNQNRRIVYPGEKIRYRRLAHPGCRTVTRSPERDASDGVVNGGKPSKSTVLIRLTSPSQGLRQAGEEITIALGVSGPG